MFKNYRKISIIAFLNIGVILLLQFAHESTIALSHTMMFNILFIYAVINGIYIQRVLFKQRRIEISLEKERLFSNKILETMSSGLLIANKVGEITYVNKASFELFSTDDCLGKHLSSLFLDNKEVLDLYENAKLGEVSSKITVEKNGRYLLIQVYPFKLDDELLEIMIHVDDVTENIELNKFVELQYLNMFKSFVKFIDAKDTYTGQHSVSVSDYVAGILDKFELDDNEKKEILTAANLHDIGKVGVPESILNKAGKLTENEYDKMKQHPVIGQSLIGEISGYENIGEIIRHHHERYDGSGYPDGLIGNDIPLGSRIISVADAFDAITSDRIYRKKRSYYEAIKILKSEGNHQFDKVVVDVFVESIRGEYENT